jgi:hypothetical protein
MPRTQILSSQTPEQNYQLILSLGMGHVENTAVPLLQSNCCIIKNLLPSNGNVFTEPLHRNGPDIIANLAVVA